MRRIYLNTPLAVGEHCTLPEDAFHYAVRVLRCKTGEKLCVFNGDGNDYSTTLELQGKKSATLIVEHSQQNHNESPVSLTLLQGLSKGERMDIVMQKAVELGVQRIIPIRTDFCAVKLNDERLEKKMQHWQSIIISACEQSERAVIPELLPIATLDEALTKHHSDINMVLHPYETDSPIDLSQASPSSVTIAVGPEGGFSESEVTCAQSHGVQSLMLGKRILRTETAALAALSVCQHLWGDWNGA